ncbi:hypothetical protein DC498_15470 [Terrimonas sp.]|uniref:hypothetical protein n=1 Tax=Terrimonas sp. TaxID=1914338 RepID=UPI000D516380|nr:hypothetical protein [Terrimonas sp.]PVD51278.1 hypothetical protein DC498_15470 [Terrimonas sp.]
MKHLKLPLLILALCISISSFAQRIKVLEGDIPADFKDQKSVNTEFTYENIGVGKYDKEEDYIKAKTEEYNQKEPGRGDNWAKSWIADRKNRFEPKFDELFTKYSDLTLNKNSKYTIIFHTTFLEPGFNIGITRKNATINGEALIVETANKSKVLAKISIDKAPGKSFWGNDYDTGERLSECYATAGRAVGKFVKK